jgi:DNA modification methylase
MTMNKIVFGDNRITMKQLIDEGVKVQMCVTSPPYYGLRDYGTGTWEGGDPNCSHKRDSKTSDKCITGHVNLEGAVGDGIYKDVCPRCNAKRKDLQIGLEQTPEDYIKEMVNVFRLVKDLLTNDGVIWVNIGDSYSSYKDCKSIGQTLAKGTNREEAHVLEKGSSPTRNTKMLKSQGLKNKDLIGIPWMLAFALRADGWYLRQDIIWHKPNPMPESVTDRCTKAHEYIFLLSKSDKYFFDNEAIKEPSVNSESYKGRRKRSSMTEESEKAMDKFGATRSGFKNIDEGKTYPNKNKRSVWTITTKPYKGAHFATFPKDLIEPCIKAGTSEIGHCPVCNARWKRIKIDTGKRHDVEIYTGKAVKDYEDASVQNPSDTKRRVLESMSKIYKHEWIPTCECKEKPVADIVFDPFMGSGTTAQVALELGRQYLGCELNSSYETLQQERISSATPQKDDSQFDLFKEVA